MTRLKSALATMGFVTLVACGTPSSRPTDVGQGYGYGVVESITLVERDNSGIGLGTVAGGVVGGILGNQVGGGRGQTAATIAGAAGGAYAGHQIEKSQRSKENMYRITVRMEDGGHQTITQDSNPFRVGDHVRIVDGRVTYP